MSQYLAAIQLLENVVCSIFLRIFEAFDLCCGRPCVVSIYNNLAFNSIFCECFFTITNCICYVILHSVVSKLMQL